MNFILALLTTAILAITPTHGPAPFHPDITIKVAGPFTGQACIIVSQDAQTLTYFCLETTAAKDESSTVKFETYGSIPGVYSFTGYLIADGNGEITQLNTLTVTVE